MRRILLLTLLASLTALSALALAAPAQQAKDAPAQQAKADQAVQAKADQAVQAKADQAVQAKDAPRLEDVLSYINLFGYREMMELSVDHQLGAIMENIRTEHRNVPPQSLEIIQQELRKELKPATERSLNAMAKVFQRHLTQADVDYLMGVGRDPRMQKVVKLQPKLAVELEKVGEGLAQDVYQRAAPRIQERLKRLEGGENT